MILLTDEEIITAIRDGYETVEGVEIKVIYAKSIAKAQLKKVEDWLRTLLDDPELQDAKGTIGFIGLTLRGERLKEVEDATK